MVDASFFYHLQMCQLFCASTQRRQAGADVWEYPAHGTRRGEAFFNMLWRVAGKRRGVGTLLTTSP